MALKTQGFALSSMPRSPAIPANVGAVDVKEIYDGVRQGLAAFENVRRAPASMLLADAEMAAKTAEAPLGTRQVLAQTEGLEAQTPLKTAILARQASPGYLDAQQQALAARGQKPLTGTAFLLNRVSELERGVVENPDDQLIQRELADARGKLEEARTIAAGNVAGRAETTETNVTAQKEIAAAAEKARIDRDAAVDTRIRELAASNEQMRRDLAAQALLSAEKRTGMTVNAPAKRTDPGLQHSDNLTRAEDDLRTARTVFDDAAQSGDEGTITAAKDTFDQATRLRDSAQKAYDLFHAERTKKVADDGTARLAAAIAARGRGTAPAPPAAPTPAAAPSNGPATPAELLAAVKAKTMTPDQAKAYATSKGWK